MICARCQHENPAGQKFCGECAAPLVAVCAGCGAANPPGNRFCGQCAAPLRTAGKAPSPESYTPKHLAERILTSKTSLEDERKQVTVLFADLKGSMELLADRDPEEARKLLDPVLEHMMEAVHRYEGTVNQVMGDGIMALFGAPLAHEDHAVRACYAALRMQESVKRYAEGIFRTYGVPVRIRVGLNSGEVVVRSIGSDLHMDYTAVGQTTHLAARMEQLADPGTILMAPATVPLAEGYVQLTSRGPVAVKGLAEPVEVYELTGVSATRSRLHAAAVRGLSRFVGRDTEMEQLYRALGQAQQGRGQVAAIVGEPRVGKSRLVFELTHSHRVEGWLVLEAGSVSYGKATSYLPVIDLLKGYFKIHDRDTHRDIREKVTGKLLTLDEGLRPIVSPVVGLLDVPVEDPQWAELDPQQRRQRTLEGVKRLLLRESQVQPLLVVFEDLHWIDSETQALIESLVDSLPASRLLLLVNYRPEYSHGWGSKTYYTQLRLDALPAETAGALLESLLGRDPSVEPLKPLLAARTGGNPLFLEESVRGLVETHVLAGERGAYRLTHPVEAIQVPPTVQAILAARIDRLPPEDKALLQAAAVIGKDVPFALLKEIAETPEDGLRQGLAHLQAAEFLYESSLFPDLEYTFKHALTHEVAYGGLLQERRRTLHAKIVNLIERLYADRLPEHVERLAYHALRGELWAKAIHYCTAVGHRALRFSAYRDSLDAFDRALEALAHLPQSVQHATRAIDIRLSLRIALVALGEYARMFRELSDAETIAEQIGDVHRLGSVRAYLAYASILFGDLAHAIDLSRRVFLTVDPVNDLPVRTAALLHLSRAHFARGEYEHAIDSARDAIAPLTGSLRYEHMGVTGLPSVGARTWLACALVELGRFPEAHDVGTSALEIARTANHPYSIIFPCWGLGFLHVRIGEFQVGARILEEALDLCESQVVPGLFPTVASHLAAAYTGLGRVADSLALLERAHARAHAMGLLFGQATRLGWLSETFLLSGCTDKALQVAEESLDVARRRGGRGQEAWALRLLGEINVRSGTSSCKSAENRHQEALGLATQLSMRPLVAHCHGGLAKLYRRTGQHDRAQEHLTLATTVDREMGMTYWLEKLEGEMKELV